MYGASYIQFPNRAAVEVTVKGQAVTGIRVVSHITLLGRKAEGPIAERIIASQSTQVDAVTGATNSSKCITKAVQRAIEKAYQR